MKRAAGLWEFSRPPDDVDKAKTTEVVFLATTRIQIQIRPRSYPCIRIRGYPFPSQRMLPRCAGPGQCGFLVGQPASGGEVCVCVSTAAMRKLRFSANHSGHKRASGSRLRARSARAGSDSRAVQSLFFVCRHTLPQTAHRHHSHTATSPHGANRVTRKPAQSPAETRAIGANSLHNWVVPGPFCASAGKGDGARFSYFLRPYIHSRASDCGTLRLTSS